MSKEFIEFLAIAWQRNVSGKLSGQCQLSTDSLLHTRCHKCHMHMSYNVMTEAAEINQFRKMLFSIAYNMLGSISDAEDMVQDTYLSWLAADKSHVLNPKFYLIRTITNKCITHLNNIRRQRETYIGTWLPDPLLSSTDDESENNKLSIGFLYLLEKLTPIERGVIVLREAFDLPYKEIAQIFGINEENCRQKLSRAKKKLQDEKRRFVVKPNSSDKILQQFITACENKRLDKLVELLCDDVTSFADGGGKAAAISEPVTGKENVARLIYKGMEWYRKHERKVIHINGLSGLAFYKNKVSTTAVALMIIETDANEKIVNFYYMVNPEKLQYLSNLNFH